MDLQFVYGCSDEIKEVKNVDGGVGNEVSGGGGDRRLPGFLYADDLVLCGKSEEDLNSMAGHFAEV